MLMLLRSSFLVAVVGHARSSSNSSSSGFPVGVISPCTALTQDLLGCAVLVDLDLRKHTEPELVERFGPPIVNLSRHSDLYINFQIGTDDSSVSTALRTTLKWMQGSADGVEQVIGVAGTLFSSIVGPIASTVAAFDTPQVSIGGSAASLGDRVLYPYLVRVDLATTFRGQAVWSWMLRFQVNSVSFFYSKEAFGESIFQTTAHWATKSGQPGKVSGAGVPIMTEEDLDMTTLLAVCGTVKSLGSKVVVIAVSDTGFSTSVMYGFEQLGMLYSEKYQFVGAGGLGYVPSRELAPTLGYPIGIHAIDPQSTGPAYPGLRDMWSKMVPDDVYGPDAVARYMLDRMEVLPWEASRPMLTADDFAREPFPRCSNLFDATYTFIVAINNLLVAGTPRQEIAGQTLLQALKNVTFAGAMGDVEFDHNADRLGDFTLWNALQTGAVLDQRATWKASEDRWNLTTGTLVWAGGDVGDVAPAGLSSCDPGRQWDNDAGFCTLCPQNWYSAFEAGAELPCQACDAGKIGNADVGATACIACQSGTFRDLNSGNCTACPPGTHAHSAGQSVCEDCPVGRYASEHGEVSCKACGEGRSSAAHFTTMASRDINGESHFAYEQGARNLTNCGCNIDYREDGSGECVACTIGMQCLGMDDVRISPGFYAASISSTGELRVYRCFGEHKRCIGGLPGSTCAPGREGLACARCEDGKTPSSDGTCVQCGDADTLPVITASLLAISALFATYHYIDQQKPEVKNTKVLLCVIALGQTLTVAQQIGVVSEMSLRIEDPLKSVIDTLSVATFDIDLLRPDCVSSQRPVERFATKVCIIYMGIGAVLLIHACIVSYSYRFRFRERMHVLVGVVGTLFMVLYLAVTSTLLKPFQCVSHPEPNVDWTVRSYPSVICWKTDEHSIMLVVSIISFLTVPVLYLALCIAVVMKFPSKVQDGDSRFLKAFSFLFFRFRPCCYAFVLVQTLRSFVIAAILVIPDTVTQLIALQVALLCGYSATLYALPWRVQTGNALDLASNAGILVFVLMVSFFIEETDKNLSSVSALSAVLLGGVLAVLPAGAGRALYLRFGQRRKPYEFFLTHHKAASGAYTRLLKIFLVEKRRLRSGSVFLDADNLDSLDRLFDYVGNDTGKLVVVCTNHIFSRPWCVGEMCTAMVQNVNTMVVVFPHSKLPQDEAVIDNYMESIEDWRVLTENGIHPGTVRETLGWINQQSAVKVPQSADSAIMMALVQDLAGSASTDLSKVQLPTDTDQLDDDRSLMIYDLSNLEAAATSIIFRKMLIPLMMAQVQDVPRPLETPKLPSDVASLVFICTNGIFENPTMMGIFSSIPKSGLTLLPVVAEASFRFPSDEHSGASSLATTASNEVESSRAAVSQFARILFKEIAITFLAQVASETALELAAKTTVARLRACSPNKPRASASGSKEVPLTPSSTTSFPADAAAATDPALVPPYLHFDLIHV